MIVYILLVGFASVRVTTLLCAAHIRKKYSLMGKFFLPKQIHESPTRSSVCWREVFVILGRACMFIMTQNRKMFPLLKECRQNSLSGSQFIWVTESQSFY